MRINSITPQYNNINKQQKRSSFVSNTKNSTPAFKGGQKEALTGLSGLFEKVSKTAPFQKGVKWFARSNNTFAHLMVLESAILTSFYMFNIVRNPKIEKEQKPQMLINEGLVWGVATAGNYLVDGKIKSFAEKQAVKYANKHKDFYTNIGKKAIEKAPDLDIFSQLKTLSKENIDDGIKAFSEVLGSKIKSEFGGDDVEKIKSAVSTCIKDNANLKPDELVEKAKSKFADVYKEVAGFNKEVKSLKGDFRKLGILLTVVFIYRYLGPVVITPIANKLSSKLKDMQAEKKAQTSEIKK